MRPNTITNQGRQHYYIGAAGESLTIVDLLSQKIPSYIVAAGLKYDVVADIDGRLIRIQVKTTSKPVTRYETPEYKYSPYSKERVLTRKEDPIENDFDIIAFVALDRRLVGYQVAKGLPVTVRHSYERLRTLTFNNALKELDSL